MEERIVANNDNIENIVKSEIERLGNKADLNHIDVSGVTNVKKLFYDSNFNGDISKWDVSNVKNMYGIFIYSSFNGDISSWDVGNVENMNWMFSGSKFIQNIDMWNYNFKFVEERPDRFNLFTEGRYTLIEKYVNALHSKKFDLAERIKYKMNVIRIKYHVEGIKENKHLVSMDSNILKEFKEYLRK